MEIPNQQDTKHSCKFCNYSTSNLKDFNKHLSTRKHKILTDTNKIPNQNPAKYTMTEDRYTCPCGKQYKHLSSLCYHRKKCISDGQESDDGKKDENIILSTTEIVVDISKQPSETTIVDKLMQQNKNLHEMILAQFKENAEIKNLLLEQNNQLVTLSKNAGSNNNNVYNNKFNINVFLNEQCKDAINMTEFINYIQIRSQDLEYTATHGFVEGYSKIISDGLKELGVYKRPLHCTDQKREGFYIKDENKWNKETGDTARNKIHRLLDHVLHKKITQMQQWKEENPESAIVNSKPYELHADMMYQMLGGGMNQTDKNRDKVITNIAKNVVLSGKDTTN